MDDPTLTIPKRHLCPMCADHAESFTRYEESRKRHEAEDRLRSGRASTPERIKAAWDNYGKGREWPKNCGYVIRVPERTFLTPAAFDQDLANEPVGFTTFEFRRDVTRNSDFTVTRISCGGLTVEETVS